MILTPFLPLVTELLKLVMQWKKEKFNAPRSQGHTKVIFGPDGRVAKKFQVKENAHE
jgi:hypothetical protein